MRCIRNDEPTVPEYSPWNDSDRTGSAGPIPERTLRHLRISDPTGHPRKTTPGAMRDRLPREFYSAASARRRTRAK